MAEIKLFTLKDSLCEGFSSSHIAVRKGKGKVAKVLLRSILQSEGRGRRNRIPRQVPKLRRLDVCIVRRLQSSRKPKVPLFLGSDFGRTGFSRIFNFGPSDFFADFLAGFYLLVFVVKKFPEKSSRKIPGKINTPKIPNTFLQRGRANSFVSESGDGVKLPTQRG